MGSLLYGDFVYSNGKNPFNVEGQMLHAKKIEFIHPSTKEEICIEAPLPKYFEKVIKELENVEEDIS